MYEQLVKMNPINIDGESLRVYASAKAISTYYANGDALNAYGNPSIHILKITLVLQGWEYTDPNENNWYKDIPFYIEIKPGMVDFISSRESLDMTARTKKFFEVVKQKILEQKYAKESLKNFNRKEQLAIASAQERSHHVPEWLPVVKENLGEFKSPFLYYLERGNNNKNPYTVFLLRNSSYYNDRKDILTREKQTVADRKRPPKYSSRVGAFAFYNKDSRLIVIHDVEDEMKCARKLHRYALHNASLTNAPILITKEGKKETAKKLPKLYRRVTWIDEKTLKKNMPKKTGKAQAKRKKIDFFAENSVYSVNLIPEVKNGKVLFDLAETEDFEENEKKNIAIVMKRHYYNHTNDDEIVKRLNTLVRGDKGENSQKDYENNINNLKENNNIYLVQVDPANAEKPSSVRRTMLYLNERFDDKKRRTIFYDKEFEELTWHGNNLCDMFADQRIEEEPLLVSNDFDNTQALRYFLARNIPNNFGWYDEDNFMIKHLHALIEDYFDLEKGEIKKLKREIDEKHIQNNTVYASLTSSVNSELKMNEQIIEVINSFVRNIDYRVSSFLARLPIDEDDKKEILTIVFNGLLKKEDRKAIVKAFTA